MMPMTESKREPWNPFYTLLILAGVAFVILALAYALVPILEQKAIDAGSKPPPSPLRQSLKTDGWLWLLYLGGAIVVLGLASMIYDRFRGGKTPPTSS
jgi:Na+/proline symporter